MPSMVLKRGQRLVSGASLLGCALFLSVSSGVGQTTPASKIAVPDAEVAATRAQMTTLRDEFVRATVAAGFTCPIAAPAIVVEDVPSFGQYQSSSNTLHTSDWTMLRPEERALFLHLAGPGADEASARNLFEVGSHRWVFIHELGHWWQACRGGNANHSHYQVEYGANRIALAYWREVDPEVVEKMMPVFQGIVDHAPSPVPAGQSVEEYFDKNYETLGPSPAYPWFMSRMNVSAYQERPAPTFVMVLAATKK